MIRVIAIDDHPLILKAISDELAKCRDMQLVGTADHGSELLGLVREKSPDVVILDLGMARGEFEPITAVRKLFAIYPEIQVLILTGDDNPSYMRELIAAGVKGYVLKNDSLSAPLPDAIRIIHTGKPYFSTSVQEMLFSHENELQLLSNREIQIVRMVANSSQNNTIADAVGLSEKRVRNMLSKIYKKMGIQEADGGINARVALINKARKMGYLLD